MKMTLLFSFALIFGQIHFAHADIAALPGDECESESQMENAECVGLKLSIANDELISVFSALRSRLGSEAPEVDRRLVKSQQAWTAFRAADCSLEGAELLGGNGESFRVRRCELAKTQERMLRLTESAF